MALMHARSGYSSEHFFNELQLRIPIGLMPPLPLCGDWGHPGQAVSCRLLATSAGTGSGRSGEDRDFDLAAGHVLLQIEELSLLMPKNRAELRIAGRSVDIARRTLCSEHGFRGHRLHPLKKVSTSRHMPD
jgi:hypothetical protein